MNLPLSAPLPVAGVIPAIGAGGLPQKGAGDYPTKFEDIAPGSTILISGSGVAEPFEATVMDVMPEHGPTSIPALLVSANQTSEEFIITSSGLYVVSVLIDARDIAAAMPAPKNAVKVRSIPHTAEAIQFRGGIESAREIVAWAIGASTFRYVPATDVTSEQLVQSGINGDTASPGDWVLKLDTGRFTVIGESVFASEFEETL
jgi:hypothetical protein